MNKEEARCPNSRYVAIAGEVVNRSSVLLIPTAHTRKTLCKITTRKTQITGKPIRTCSNPENTPLKNPHIEPSTFPNPKSHTIRPLGYS